MNRAKQSRKSKKQKTLLEFRFWFALLTFGEKYQFQFSSKTERIAKLAARFARLYFVFLKIATIESKANTKRASDKAKKIRNLRYIESEPLLLRNKATLTRLKRTKLETQTAKRRFNLNSNFNLFSALRYIYSLLNFASFRVCRNAFTLRAALRFVSSPACKAKTISRV